MIIFGCACGGVGEYFLIVWILSIFGVSGLGWSLKGTIHKFWHHRKKNK